MGTNGCNILKKPIPIQKCHKCVKLCRVFPASLGRITFWAILPTHAIYFASLHFEPWVTWMIGSGFIAKKIPHYLKGLEALFMQYNTCFGDARLHRYSHIHVITCKWEFHVSKFFSHLSGLLLLSIYILARALCVAGSVLPSCILVSNHGNSSFSLFRFSTCSTSSSVENCPATTRHKFQRIRHIQIRKQVCQIFLSTTYILNRYWPHFP